MTVFEDEAIRHHMENELSDYKISYQESHTSPIWLSVCIASDQITKAKLNEDEIRVVFIILYDENIKYCRIKVLHDNTYNTFIAFPNIYADFYGGVVRLSTPISNTTVPEIVFAILKRKEQKDNG